MIYHAHIYWKNSDQKNIAMAQRTLLNQLNCGVGMIYDEIIGPHPLPMYEVNYFDDTKNKLKIYWLKQDFPFFYTRTLEIISVTILKEQDG